MSIRRIFSILSTILALLCLFLEHSSADTCYVSHSGSDTPPYTSWETAATSIQSAIDAASEGDTILIAPGMFAGGVTLRTGISLSGSGADETQISCGLDPVLTCQGVREASIRDLGIFHGYVSGGNGAGIHVIGSSGLTIRNCNFIKNRTFQGSGAGISIEDSQGIVVADCVFQNNECEYGLGGAVYVSRSSVEILGSRIQGNRAEEGGGGIFLGSSGKVCRIADCEIVANVAPYGYGGGLACYAQGEISDCVVANNSAQGDGGGIWCGEAMRVQRSVICNNRAESSSLREGRGGEVESVAAGSREEALSIASLRATGPRPRGLRGYSGRLTPTWSTAPSCRTPIRTASTLQVSASLFRLRPTAHTRTSPIAFS